MPSGHLLLDPTIHFFRLPSNSKQVFKLLCCCCCCCWHPWTGGWIYSYTNGKRVRRIGVGGDNICMANTAALDSCQEGTLEKYLSQSGRNLLAFTSNWTGNIWRWWFCDSEFHLQTIWSICRKVENKGNWGTAGDTSPGLLPPYLPQTLHCSDFHLSLSFQHYNHSATQQNHMRTVHCTVTKYLQYLQCGVVLLLCPWIAQH